MTWQVVARRDLRELLAEHTLLYFSGFFALLGAGISLLGVRGQQPTPLPNLLAILFTFAVPLTAGTLAHGSIPRSVSSGRIRLSLSLPHSRRAFVAGVGAATAIATLAAAVAAVLAGLVVYLVYGGPTDVLGVVALFALAALLAAAFVGATLAFTARSRSTTLSAATAFGFFLLSFLWPAFVAAGTAVLVGPVGVPVPPGTAETVTQLSPIYAYQNAAAAVGLGLSGPAGRIPEWGGVVVLFAWASLGYAAAARRFDGIDL